MTTPARKHFQRVTAAVAAAAAGTVAMVGDAYQLMLAALIEDRRRLKDIQSIERKIDAKREMLPNYVPYVAGVLESGQGAEDEVLMTVMIWCFDVGQLVMGLDIAEYALKHGLNPPDRYERSTAAIVAEEVADNVLKQLEGEVAAERLAELFQAVQRADVLTADIDMHDQIRAKLAKALGYVRRDLGQLDPALETLKRALELNDRIGVKKDIERLEREIKKATDQAQT